MSARDESDSEVEIDVANYPLVSLPLTRRHQPPVNPFGHLY